LFVGTYGYGTASKSKVSDTNVQHRREIMYRPTAGEREVKGKYSRQGSQRVRSIYKKRNRSSPAICKEKIGAPGNLRRKSKKGGKKKRNERKLGLTVCV